MPVGRGIPIRNPMGARIAILTAALTSKGSAMVEYIIGGRKRTYNIPSAAMPPITNTRFFILFFAILELSRLPAPLDISKVNNNSAKVIVGLPIKRMSFCRSASSINMKPMPRAAKYGITVAIPISLFFVSTSFSPLLCLIHTKGTSKNIATIPMLA